MRKKAVASTNGPRIAEIIAEALPPIVRDVKGELRAELYAVAKAMQENAAADRAQPVTFAHWDAPLEVADHAHGGTINIATLADRADTLAAMGYSLVIEVKRPSETRGPFSYVTNRDYEVDRVVFRAVPKC